MVAYRYCRFLQSPSSNLRINREEAIQEHALATVTCLLSGFDIFRGTYQEHSKYVQVVKGLHGLHLYATKYWTEYLLCIAASTGGINIDSPLFALASRLADKLNETVQSTTSTVVDSQSNSIDERLKFLQHHKALYKLIGEALKARSLKKLELEHLQQGLSFRRNPAPSLIH